MFVSTQYKTAMLLSLKNKVFETQIKIRVASVSKVIYLFCLTNSERIAQLNENSIKKVVPWMQKKTTNEILKTKPASGLISPSVSICDKNIQVCPEKRREVKQRMNKRRQASNFFWLLFFLSLSSTNLILLTLLSLTTNIQKSER